MDDELIRRYGAPVPRYTSYPTANHFAPTVGVAEQRSWLAAIADDARLSLYLHVPFCRSLCWYCACSTKAIRRAEPLLRYLDVVHTEIRHLSRHLKQGQRVVHVHLGGGSPSLLQPDSIARLWQVLHRHFTFAAEAEIAVEMDPRDAGPEQADAFVAAGITRVSLGVQDFDPAVQAAINRIQSVETTRRTVDLFRARGVRSVNIDLVYGLPHQTRASLAQTMQRVLELEPDRLAIFGYAHLPARVPQQRLIDDRSLPALSERFAFAQLLSAMARDAGYVAIGIDHFALPEDAMARGPARRNFQGYTTDPADALIGLGASAISQLPGGYVQNAVPMHDYERRTAEHGSATARGIRVDEEDRMRALVIERLMCDLAFPGRELRAQFGGAARPLLAEAGAILRADCDGLLAATPDGFVVTDRGRPFTRTICSWFDAYLTGSGARHSLAV